MLAASRAPARAQAPAPGIEWLMNEPVTLFDLGMHRLRLDMEAASRALPDAATAEPPLYGVFYQWWDRQIIAYLTLRQAMADPTARNCRETFAFVLERLLRATPQGARRGAVYLENLFLHTGPGNYGRPENIGEQLLAMVRLEVALLPPPPAFTGGPTMRCAGQLDSDPAAIVVSGTQ